AEQGKHRGRKKECQFFHASLRRQIFPCVAGLLVVKTESDSNAKCATAVLFRHRGLMERGVFVGDALDVGAMMFAPAELRFTTPRPNQGACSETVASFRSLLRHPIELLRSG